VPHINSPRVKKSKDRQSQFVDLTRDSIQIIYCAQNAVTIYNYTASKEKL